MTILLERYQGNSFITKRPKGKQSIPNVNFLPLSLLLEFGLTPG